MCWRENFINGVMENECHLPNIPCELNWIDFDRIPIEYGFMGFYG